MSDKKQPAQQRVNVRIVKADDPEQRGGMKPIAKADGSLQITPEEAYTAGIWAKPPFDLRGLSKMVDESTILPQCIRAYKSNIAGFGIDIRYKDDFADANETPEMKAEWDRATEVVEMLNMEQESNELFEDIVEARETYGCAYAEVIDAYLAKAENDLYEQLTMEGYLKAKESLNTVDEIEEVVTKLLEDNADDLLKELADAIDLETFFKDNWPKFKNKSKLSRDLFDVFHTQFSTIMPTYVEAYVQKTDAELTVTKLTKRTTDWISSWSSDLADIMKLDTETEIEAVLKKGLNDGKGINDVANLIADSGIRSPGYRARRVALTEVLRAHGYAQLESYIQSPAVEEKMWKHTGAYRNDPRQNHVDMDGVHVPKGQPFTLIGADGNTYYPMAPRDVCLPPRESVNCLCLLQPVVSEEVLGLSLEERQALQAQAIAEDDGEWEKELDAQNKARAGINEEDYT